MTQVWKTICKAFWKAYRQPYCMLVLSLLDHLAGHFWTDRRIIPTYWTRLLTSTTQWSCLLTTLTDWILTIADGWLWPVTPTPDDWTLPVTNVTVASSDWTWSAVTPVDWSSVPGSLISLVLMVVIYWILYSLLTIIQGPSPVNKQRVIKTTQVMITVYMG